MAPEVGLEGGLAGLELATPFSKFYQRPFDLAFETGNDQLWRVAVALDKPCLGWIFKAFGVETVTTAAFIL